MQQRFPTSAPSSSNISEILHVWYSALAAARASQEPDLYACVVVLIGESLERFTTVDELINAYCFPDSALNSRVLGLCGGGAVHLQPEVALGAACALRFRELMEAAIA
jgi:hypothetical protein